MRTTLLMWIASGLRLKIGWPVGSVTKSTKDPIRGQTRVGRQQTWWNKAPCTLSFAFPPDQRVKSDSNRRTVCEAGTVVAGRNAEAHEAENPHRMGIPHGGGGAVT